LLFYCSSMHFKLVALFALASLSSIANGFPTAGSKVMLQHRRTGTCMSVNDIDTTPKIGTYGCAPSQSNHHFWLNLVDDVKDRYGGKISPLVSVYDPNLAFSFDFTLDSNDSWSFYYEIPGDQSSAVRITDPKHVKYFVYALPPLIKRDNTDPGDDFYWTIVPV